MTEETTEQPDKLRDPKMIPVVMNAYGWHLLLKYLEIVMDSKEQDDRNGASTIHHAVAMQLGAGNPPKGKP